MFECWYESDKDKFIKLLLDKGATLWKILYVGTETSMGGSYLIIYRYTEELDMEILC